jgi:pimeloyl-ACP methyl ester carboxylesterase
MQHKTIAGRHGAIHYWTQGNAPGCILFTHGATMDHGLFQYQIEPLSQQFTVISWDAPAHGLSRLYPNFSLQNAAHEIAAILEAEGIAKAHLVGQSMGGYISQIAAVEYPQKVQSITAIGSSPIQLAYYSRMDQWLLSLTPAILNFYPYGMLIQTIGKQIAISVPAQKYAYETLQKFTKSEIAHIMDQVYQGLLQYDHAQLACPILITYGDRDRTGKVQAYCNRWAAQEKRPLSIIPHAAHNANMDNPQAFNRILQEFLSKIN